VKKPTITKHDRDRAIGMYLAHQFYRWVRDEKGLTALQAIQDMMESIGFPHYNEIEGWLLTEADNAATQMEQAVRETNEREDIPQPNEKMKNYFMKQAIVMGAISEVELHLGALNGNVNPDSIGSILDQENVTPAEIIKALTNGLDPKLVETIAMVVCEDSYPNVNATHEVMEALWLEGFFIAAFAGVVSKEAKNTPTWDELNAKLCEKFEVV
jgi:hypothetical protein